jgi:hypothetical protein
MQPLESVGVVKATPKVATYIKAPENATAQMIQQSVATQAHEATSVNPNDKKYKMYNQYERAANSTSNEQDLKQFRVIMATYLTHSQSLIESGDNKASTEHLERLMKAFSFSESSPLVIEMYRLLSYVHNSITLNGLSDTDTRQSLSRIIRNIKEGFYDE